MEVKTFHGGVHPAGNKELSKESPLTPYLPVGDLVFLTNQHIGKPATPVVKKGDSWKKPGKSIYYKPLMI